MNSKDTALRDQDIAHGQNIPASRSSGIHSPKGSQPKNQIPVLNGIRAVACLSVLSYHLNELAAGAGIWGPLYNIHNVTGILTYFIVSTAYSGDSGVNLFFLLSGFLLFLPYAKALLFDSPWPSVHRFYLRRIFRILPGYYIAFFFIALFFNPEFLHSINGHDLQLFLTLCMVSPLTGKVNIAFWSLAIEFQFYFLLPIVVWLFSMLVCRGAVRWRMLKLTLCLLVMTAWGLLTRYWGLYIADTPKLDFLIPHSVSIALKPYLYSDTGKFFEVFALGMFVSMVYTYMQYAPSAQYWSMRMHRLSSLLLTVGLAIVLFMALCRFYLFDIDAYRYAHHPKYYVVFTFLDSQITTVVVNYWFEWQALVYAIGYGFCLLALLYGSAWLKRPFEGSTLGWVGSISFSLYMWHLPFLHLFVPIIVNIQQQGWDPLVQYSAFWCWVLIVIFPLSTALYRWIEQPGMRLGEWLIRKL